MLQGGTGHDGDGTLPDEPLEDVAEDHGAASVECRYLLVWQHFTRPITPPSKPWYPGIRHGQRLERGMSILPLFELEQILAPVGVAADKKHEAADGPHAMKLA